MASRWIVAVVLFAIATYFTREYFQGGVCHSTKRLDGKTVVITGGNTGIGKETAIDLARRGARVIIGCRDLNRGNAAVKDIKETSGSQQVFVELLDLASLSSVRRFAENIVKNEARLDILINNAGTAWIPAFQRTIDGFEMIFGVNHLGHFLLTNLFLDLLKRSAPSRVVTVSSVAHRFSASIDLDNWNKEELYTTYGHLSYSNSKLANVLFSRELGKKLDGTGVTTYSLHPGTMLTDLMRHVSGAKYLKVILWPLSQIFLKTIIQGAQTTICCAVADEHANETGLYYSDCAVKEPSKAAQDDAAAKKLWDMSVKLVKLSE